MLRYLINFMFPYKELWYYLKSLFDLLIEYKKNPQYNLRIFFGFFSILIIFTIMISCICFYKVYVLQNIIIELSEPGEIYIKSNEMKNKVLLSQREFCNIDNVYIILYCKKNDFFICKINLGSYPVKNTAFVNNRLYNDYNYNFFNIIHLFKKVRDNLLCVDINKEDIAGIKEIYDIFVKYIDREDISMYRFCLFTDINYGILIGYSENKQKCFDSIDIDWILLLYRVKLLEHKKIF